MWKPRTEVSEKNHAMRPLLYRSHRTLRSYGRFILAAAWLCAPRYSHAQTPPAGTPHSVTLAWVAPSPVGGSGTVAGYNVYKSVAGAAFAKINTAVIVGLTTTDLAVSAGQSVSYCATTVDTAAEESACSVSVSATIPTNPNPPVLSKPVIAMVRQGNQNVLTATWSDDSHVLTSYVVYGSNSVLAIGVPHTNATGQYSIRWKGVPQDGFVVVSDREGNTEVTPFHAI